MCPTTYVYVEHAYMKRKGIIFDLDGVLVSTDKLNYKAWKQVVDGINVSKVIKINQASITSTKK